MTRRLPKQRGGTRAIPWKYGSIICIVVALLLLYLWEQTQVTQLDARIRQMRSDIKRMRIENSRLNAEVISLSEWGTIVERAEQDLKMTYPRVEQMTLIQYTHDDRSLSPDQERNPGYR